MVEDALRSFVELMDSGDLSGLLPFVLGAFALGVLLVLLHELGHAAVALACTESLVLLRVGRYPGALRGRIGRLQISLDVRRGHEGGRAVVFADLTPGERLAYSLAGPAANLAFALLLVPSFLAVSGGWQWTIGVAIGLSTLLALQNLVSRDSSSDGQRALAALRVRGRHTPNDFADAVGKWLALYGRSGEARFSNQRVLLFVAVLPELGLDPGSRNAEARDYCDAARAGWCWREVRPAPEAPVAEPARDAWKEQSLEGRTGLDLAAAAAAVVARRGALAGTDDGFVVFSELGGMRDDDERRRFAFRYGAALHDVEQVLAAAGERYW